MTLRWKVKKNLCSNPLCLGCVEVVVTGGVMCGRIKGCVGWGESWEVLGSVANLHHLAGSTGADITPFDVRRRLTPLGGTQTSKSIFNKGTRERCLTRFAGAETRC